MKTLYRPVGRNTDVGSGFPSALADWVCDRIIGSWMLLGLVGLAGCCLLIPKVKEVKSVFDKSIYISDI